MSAEINEIIPGINGYSIPCRHNLTGTEAMVAVVCHGFGSSKESSTASMLMEVLATHSIGLFAFDFPAHGKSPVDGDFLRIQNCLDDLSQAEKRASQLCPKAEIVYFSSSFGAYINLLYLSTRPHLGKKSFLRCAAVDMPGIIHDLNSLDCVREFEAHGYCMMDYGHTRPLKLTNSFSGDLLTYNVFRLYEPEMASLAMIHGQEDEVASFETAQRFAMQANAQFISVPGADHIFSNPGGMEAVYAAALAFYNH